MRMLHTEATNKIESQCKDELQKGSKQIKTRNEPFFI